MLFAEISVQGWIFAGVGENFASIGGVRGVYGKHDGRCSR